MSDFVKVWNRATGEELEYLVPKHWLKHPVLGKQITDQPPNDGGFSLPENSGEATKAAGDSAVKKEGRK